MIKKLTLMLGIAILLSSAPISGFSQDNDKTETHTGVKRTYHKAKRKVKKAATDTKNAATSTYNKAKTRVKTDDATKDANERK